MLPPRRLIAGAAALAAAVLAVAALSGAFGDLDRERLASLLRDAGPAGPVAFVLLFALLEPFGVPGIAFVAPATLVWSLEVAFLLSWLGAVGAGVVGFTFARTLGRGFAARHLPERFRRYDERLEARGLVTVIAVRLVFFLAPPAHWMLGLSRVRFLPFLLGTALGFAPGIALLVLFGRGLVELVQARPAWTLAALAVTLLVVLGWRRRGRARGTFERADRG